MKIKNLTNEKIFLPIQNKIGITLPEKATATVDEEYRNHSAINYYVTSGSLEVIEEDKGVAGFKPEVVSLKNVKKVITFLHDKPYFPFVQAVSDEGKVLQVDVVHVDDNRFDVDFGKEAFTGKVIYG